MKKYILMLFLVPSAMPALAQTADEWLRQKETALRYAVEQLAALRSQSGIVQQGYAIVDAGLQTIATIKGEDYSLHQAFQAALEKINPALRQQASLQSLHAQHAWLELEIRKLTAACSRAGDYLTHSEITYLEKVLGRLQQQAREGAKHLDALCSTGAFTLTDADRSQRIAVLAQATREDLAFLKTLKQQTSQLLLQRRAEQAAIVQLRKMSGL